MDLSFRAIWQLEDQKVSDYSPVYALQNILLFSTRVSKHDLPSCSVTTLQFLEIQVTSTHKVVYRTCSWSQRQYCHTCCFQTQTYILCEYTYLHQCAGCQSLLVRGAAVAVGKIVVCSVSQRKSLSWIRMTRTARQDARRSGKEDAGHSLFLGGCLFGFYREHNSKNRKGSCRDVTWRGLVVTWRLIRDWSYLLNFRRSAGTRYENRNVCNRLLLYTF